jgi:hypothetical protein
VSEPLSTIQNALVHMVQVRGTAKNSRRFAFLEYSNRTARHGAIARREHSLRESVGCDLTSNLWAY